MRRRRCPCWRFAFALSLITGVLFGTAPAWLASHADPAEALRGANRTTRDRSSISQKILVIVQATLSVVLLAGAGLLTHSLQKLQHQDFGYRDRSSRHHQPDRAVFFLLAAEAGRDVPRHCRTGSRTFPESSARRSRNTRRCTDNWGEIVIRQGHGMPNMNEQVGSSWDHVNPGYLETLGETICAGAASPSRTRRPRKTLSWSTKPL